MSILHYKEFGEGKPLLIFHGLFGMLDNWQTHAKIWSEKYRVFIVDLRNHGHSFWSDDMNYECMAEDIHSLMEQLQIEKAFLLGHSMGGKAVMQFAQVYPDKIEKLIVADIAPRAYKVHHRSILDALLEVEKLQVESRQEADSILKKHIPELTVRQFLLKSLHWENKGKLAFRFNVQAINKHIEAIGQGDFHESVHVPTLFLRGELSNYITETDISLITELFPYSILHTIQGAGHWLHAEKPTEFIEEVNDFLED
jgi:esterase